MAWWREQQQLASGWRPTGRRGNLWRWEAPLQRWADAQQRVQTIKMPWSYYAADRDTWRSLLPSFIQSMVVRVDRHELLRTRKRQRHRADSAQ